MGGYRFPQNNRKRRGFRGVVLGVGSHFRMYTLLSLVFPGAVGELGSYQFQGSGPCSPQLKTFGLDVGLAGFGQKSTSFGLTCRGLSYAFTQIILG